MGSSQSKNNNEEEEEILSGYKHRIQFIKQAVSTRKALFAWLATYDKEELPVRPVVNKGVIREIEIRRSRQTVSLIQIFGDLENHFLNAFERILELSQMLETSTLHSHDTRPLTGRIDHRISHLISWDQSFKGTEEIETLATLLDKILAWENKLYDEVKAVEVIKYEYQKTVSFLNEQKKQGSTINSKSLAKLDTAISHLHTRYTVEMESAITTIAEINCTRDEQLYPSLVQLVDGMEEMWKTMFFHHDSQAKIVYSLKSLENSQLLKETSEHPYDCTIHLCGAVRGWHTQFCGLIFYQKDFINALHNWSKLSLIPIETNLIEKVSSSHPRVQNAPILALLVAWKNDLDQLPDEVARNAVRNFAAVTQTIMHQQEEDLKQQQKEDDVACKKVRKAARHKSLASLRYSLLEVFSAMSVIAQACSRMYRNLRKIVEHQQASQNS